MSKNNFLQDAIADAKVIRETALLNAKTALEETLTPKIKKMLSNKLNEMEEYDEFSDNSDELDEDMDLNTILQELEDEDSLNESEDELDEAKKDDKDEDKKDDKKEKKDDKTDKKPSTPKEPKEPKDEDDEKISDMTVEELTSLIKDVVSQEMGSDEMPTDDMGDMGDMGDMDNSAPIDDMGDMGNPAPNEDDEINIDELLSELDDMYESEDKSETINETKRKLNRQTKQLQEAYKVIKTLKGEINEINLLNSKLLYVNKIFKAKNLNESQKLKVLSSFDKATNVKEVKLIFESLSSTLSNLINKQNNKSQIRENLGFASKSSGIAPKRNIMEVDPQLQRMQKLAGIK